jgi:hypothetical protein
MGASLDEVAQEGSTAAAPVASKPVKKWRRGWHCGQEFGGVVFNIKVSWFVFIA